MENNGRPDPLIFASGVMERASLSFIQGNQVLAWVLSGISLFKCH